MVEKLVKGVNVVGWKTYAESCDYVVVKKIGDEWYFEGADNSHEWAESAAVDCLRYADDVEIMDMRV